MESVAYRPQNGWGYWGSHHFLTLLSLVTNPQPEASHFGKWRSLNAPDGGYCCTRRGASRLDTG